ncbi:amidase domain-containing protein [Alteribacillus sp. YIM 98480]|uniref:amidase domain-containing protein n=1 Tax=Alteribacillus sp. YIM 98480 TaxID=2606599 RepID=UPI001E2C87FC|nr:amidase domain-containing protein [Alteribacillus sp. YIM 98480]
MRRNWDKALYSHIQEWLNFQLGNVQTRPKKLAPQEIEMLYRFRQSLQTRGAALLKMNASVQPYRVQKNGKQENITYQLFYSRLYKIGEKYHLEEHLLKRFAKTHDGNIIIDQLIHEEVPVEPKWTTTIEEEDKRSFEYDRRAAVQYAERWWNDYNPQYKKFTNNCTNFISQCLRAGKAPMRGMPNRGRGWWYGKSNWSYSWAVAHSFRWYLSGSTSGLTAVESEDVKDLGLGDIICYDFNGDGNWQHSTIVTGFDGNNEPLVNAQTENSRARYWKYEDSTAWTPNIKYKFFRIG